LHSCSTAGSSSATVSSRPRCAAGSMRWCRCRRPPTPGVALAPRELNPELKPADLLGTFQDISVFDCDRDVHESLPAPGVAAAWAASQRNRARGLA
jgi:hypothetical protein